MATRFKKTTGDTKSATGTVGELAGKLGVIASSLSEQPSAKQVMESAQQIWLAGLGAFSKAQNEGKKVFEALLESAAKYNDPSSPELGWLRAHTGLCAFESRDVFSARLAANAAREIFRAQPRVSSYYKLPLAKLDSLLAVNAGGVAPAPKN